MKSKQIAVKYGIVIIILAILSIVTIKMFNYNSDEVKDDSIDKKKIQITFASSWGGMDTKARLLQKVLKEFEKENPNITVVNKSRGNDDFLFTLKTDFAQGNDPDVFGLWPGSDMQRLIEAGKVADLTVFLDKDQAWKDSFNKQSWRYVTTDDRIYGLPVEIIYEGLYINKDLFQRYGVKVPETYEELKTAIIKFHKASIIPIAYNCTPEGTFLYQNIVTKLGGKNGTETPFRKGRIDDCYIDAMKYMREMYSLGAFPSDAFTLDDKARNELFIKKKAAMIVQGSWFVGEGSVNDDDKTVEFIPFPNFTKQEADKSAMLYGIGNGDLHMSENAYNSDEKREAALKLLRYLTSPKIVNIIINGTGSLSGIKGINKSSEQGLSAQGIELINKSKELIGPPDSFIERSFWENGLVKKFPQMLEGQISPEDIFKEVD